MRQICFTLVRCLCAQTTGHWLIKATNGKETTDRKALHNALQSVHAESRFDSQHTTVSHEQTPVLQEFTSPCEIVHKRLVGLLGLEPRTNGLKVRCSNQLSYSPRKNPEQIQPGHTFCIEVLSPTYPDRSREPEAVVENARERT